MQKFLFIITVNPNGTSICDSIIMSAYGSEYTLYKKQAKEEVYVIIYMNHKTAVLTLLIHAHTVNMIPFTTSRALNHLPAIISHYIYI